MSEAPYVARACRCCDSVPISEWAARRDGMCIKCFDNFREWGRGLNTTRQNDDSRLWATLDDSRPEVMVALDQWMEAGRPEVPPHWVTAQLPA